MNLEDHLGDIIRKQRAMTGVAAADAARAAGLNEADFSTLEESGKAPGKIKFAELASALGLNGAKLEGIANGWLPSQKDLSVWRELRQISTTQNGTEVHSYLVWDEVTREAALFDTGWDAAPALKIVADEHLQLKHLIITHSHLDHFAGIAKIREVLPKIFLHSDSKTALPQHKNRRYDHIHLGSLRITNRETPGHAEDGVTYVVGNWSEDAPYVAIVGNTKKADTKGGAGQNGELAKQKVRDQLLTLPPDTLICPGHGPLT